MLRNRRGQLLLIEILVVVAILLVIGYLIIPRYIGERSTTEEGTVAGPKERAHSVECMSNLRNIRAAIDMYRQTDEGKFPATLADLESYGVSESIRKCPVSGKEYKYDPATGSVNCNYPGHERY